MSNQSFDLTTVNGIRDYLETAFDGRYSACLVEVVSGGFANYTYRAHLNIPLSTAGLPVEGKSVIIKHSTGFASWSNGTIPFSVDRTDTEVLALETVRQSFYGDSYQGPKNVYIPGLLHYDSTYKIQIHTDFGPLPSLKQFIIDHPDDVYLARQVGQKLGEFLARLHVWGYRMLYQSKTVEFGGVEEKETGLMNVQEAMERFGKNETSRRICAWRTIGFVAKLAADYNVGTSHDWAGIVENLEKDVLEGNDTFNMGDFWTGNVLIRVSGPEDSLQLENLAVIDWELSKTGKAATDIAQFAAESVLLQNLSSPPNEAGAQLTRSFLSEYAKTLDNATSSVGGEEVSHFFESERILGHLTTHAAVIGNMVSWAKDDPESGRSAKEITDKVVKGALELCLKVGKGEAKSFRLDAIKGASEVLRRLEEI